MIPFVWNKVFYPANVLFKTVNYDENGTETVQYKDLEGKLICKKTKVPSELDNSGERITYDFTGPQNANSGASMPDEYYSTYYVYDDFGRLIYEISPRLEYILSQNSNPEIMVIDNFNTYGGEAFFNTHLYAYKYDVRGRLIAKKIPSQAEWNYFVYNKLDELVLSQTPKQKRDYQWFFSKYDALGRVVMTGTYIASDSRDDLQAAADNETVLWEQRSNAGGNIMGYTNDAFPQSMHEQLAVNYYDDYNFDIQSKTYEAIFSGVASSERTFGLITGGLTKILMSQPDDHLLTVNYYDNRQRLIQQHKQQVNLTWDRISNLFSFSGQLLSSKRLYAPDNGNPDINIQNTFSYDHTGRRVNTYFKIDNDPQFILSNRNYNALGQLIQKNLHFEPQAGDYLQRIDYRYNIRGWLTKINNAACYEDAENYGIDVFGEELYYNDVSNINLSSSYPVVVPQYNGNISAMKWKSKALASDPYYVSQKMYVYKYDNLNRMTAGYFVASYADPNNQDYFDQQINYYNEEITYGESGNILHLLRNGSSMESGAPQAIDDLEYSYDGYKAKEVQDLIAVGQSTYDGFIDGTNSGVDYTYDDSGNLINDENKDLTLDYNALNLPYSERKSSGEYITNIYDATGRKIQQTVLSSAALAGGFPPTRTDYIDGIEYVDGDLKSIMTEEGRVRLPSAAEDAGGVYHYDYFLKDHLGSVRVVLSHEPLNREYYATMEEQNSDAEEALFYNIPNTRESTPEGYPPDYSYTPNMKVSELNAAQGQTVGHAKVLRVMEGDSVSISTKYYFEEMLDSPSSTRQIGDILTQLGNIFLVNPAVSIAGNELTSRQTWADAVFSDNTDVASFLSSAFSNAASSSVNSLYTPQAYLVYLFYTDEFEFVSSMSGIMQVETPDVLGTLAVSDLVAPTKGYFYIYVANESPVFVEFDNLSILQSVSQLVEINDYYPYGLINPWLSVAPDPASANDCKFQGKQLISDVNTGSDYFGWREYDPLIARWHAADPAEQFANPYLAMGNTPSSFVDYNGAEGGVIPHFDIGYVDGTWSNSGRTAGDWMGDSYISSGGSIDGMYISSGSMFRLAKGTAEFNGMVESSSDGQVTFTRYMVYSPSGLVLGSTWDADEAIAMTDSYNNIIDLLANHRNQQEEERLNQITIRTTDWEYPQSIDVIGRIYPGDFFMFDVVDVWDHITIKAGRGVDAKKLTDFTLGNEIKGDGESTKMTFDPYLNSRWSEALRASDNWFTITLTNIAYDISSQSAFFMVLGPMDFSYQYFNKNSFFYPQSAPYGFPHR
jgi:RHS repeat-associated protein